MKILVIDDHKLFISGLRFLLSDLQEDVTIFDVNRVEDIDALSERAFDLVLLDMRLPGTSGLQALDYTLQRLSDSTVVALSSEEDALLIRRCIENGAAGFIPKSSSPEVLIHALRLILAGGVYLPALVLGDSASKVDEAGAAMTRAEASGRSLQSLLSARQKDALMLAVQGKSNKAIARDLGIAEGTVKLHLSAVFRTLGVSNRTEAVFAVAELGIVSKSL